MAHQEFDPSALLDALTDRPDFDVVREMVAWRGLPLRVLRRHLREGPGGRPGGVPGRGGGDGVAESGNREVLGLAIGDSEDGAFWTEFLQSLRERRLHSVELVVSDHHLGLKGAIAKVFVGTSRQRCRVHFMRNVLAKVPRTQSQMVAAAVRTIFAQPDVGHVTRQVAPSG